jgi:hypothetical protein
MPVDAGLSGKDDALESDDDIQNDDTKSSDMDDGHVEPPRPITAYAASRPRRTQYV